MSQVKADQEEQYESPEVFELGRIEDLTFGPSPNKTADAHGIQYDPGPVPANDN